MYPIFFSYDWVIFSLIYMFVWLIWSIVMRCFPVSGRNSFIALQTNLLQGEIVISSQFNGTFLSIKHYLFETFCPLNFYFLAIWPPTLTYRYESIRLTKAKSTPPRLALDMITLCNPDPMFYFGHGYAINSMAQ